MKAVVYTKYGPPDVLQLKEVEKPNPRDSEVLVQVHAVSINDWDWGLLRGAPFLNRLLFGLLKPKYQILGGDIAGRVEAVGSNVKQFKPDDEVFGDLSVCGWGGFAEYVCAPEHALVRKPSSMSFEEAAAIPQAAILALQGLRDKRQIQAGQKVLINGAGGGVGTFAIQIAKLYGAEVTGVDSAPKLDLMRSLGADHVIDYTQEDFTKNGQRYDLILDVMATRSIFAYRRALSPNGTFVMVGGTMSAIFQAMILGPLLSMFGSKKMGIVVLRANTDLDFMIEQFKAGIVVPVIDRRWSLSGVAEALQYYGERHTQGKIVITVAEKN